MFGGDRRAPSSAAPAAQRERESGQTSLLGAVRRRPAADEARRASRREDELPRRRRVDAASELLAFEKEALGFYISGHPLDRFGGEIRRFANATPRNCIEKGERAEVILAGVVGDFQERPMKSGTGKYAFFKLEDQTGQIEFMVEPKKLDDYRELLSSDEPLLVTGTVDAPFGDGEAVRERLRFIDAKLLARDPRREELAARHPPERRRRHARSRCQALEKLLRSHPGPAARVLRLEIPKRSETVLDLGDDYKVAASDELLARIEQIFGDRVAVLR